MPLRRTVRRVTPIAGPLAIFEPDDSGCVDLATSVVNDGTNIIDLIPRFTYNNRWWWYCCRIDHVFGRTITVQLPAANRWNSLTGGARDGIWSYDLESNEWFDWEVSTRPDGAVHMGNTTPFTRNQIYACHYPAFTSRRLARAVQAWLGSRYCQPAPSADQNGTISTATSRTNGAVGGDRQIPALPYVGLRITNFATTAAKNTIVLSGGNHPGEHNAQHAIAAAIDLLLDANDADAIDLRTYCDFYIYPTVNPQGVHGGLYRNAPDNLVDDINRTWHESSPAASECQEVIKAAILSDTGGSAAVALDYHSYGFNYGGGSNLNDLGLGNAAYGSNVAYRDAWQVLDAGYVILEWSVITSALGRWYESALSPLVALTIECGSTQAKGFAEYQQMGIHSMRALAANVRSNVFPVGP